jgi:ABC-type lipoprotein export system ATPase subunit
MCKPSVLQNVGLLSTFQVEKPLTVLLLFLNVKEQRKKRKIMQTLEIQNENNDLQSHERHGA